MIQLLFLVLFVEGMMALLLMLKIGPLRELVIKGLDQLKMGKGPATVKTIAGTMSVILASSITSILKIQNKGAKLGTLTPMDQVLWRTHLLEASLIVAVKPKTTCTHFPKILCVVVQLSVLQPGYSLFLGYVIDRLHHYLKKLIGFKTTTGASKQEFEKLHQQLKEKEEKSSKEISLLKKEVSNLIENLKKVKQESEEKDKRVLSAEAHVAALQKQSEDLLLEYDRLLEDNQNLQSQSLGYRG